MQRIVLSLAEIQTAYHRFLLTHQPHVQLGKAGMVQFRFGSAKAAEQFVTWLKDQKPLSAYNINKASVQAITENKKDIFIVRLTEEQYEFLAGLGAYLKLQPQVVAIAEQKPEPPAIPKVPLSKAELKKLLRKLYDCANNPEKFKAKLSTIPPENFQTLTSIEVGSGLDLFSYAAQLSSEKILEALIEVLPSSVLDAIIKQQKKNQQDGLEIVADCKLSVSFSKLIDKVSSTAIDEAIKNQTNHTEDALCLAAYKHNEIAFIKFIEKTSVATLITSLQVPNRIGALHLAAKNQTKNGFLTIFNKIPLEIVEPLLLTVNSDGRTTFNTMLRFQNSYTIKHVIARMTPAALEKTLLPQDANLENAFHTICAFIKPDIFKLFLEKISNDGFNKALYTKTANGVTGFNLLSYRLGQEDSIYAINKAGSAALIQALKCEPTSDIENALHHIAKVQSPRAFHVFINKVDPNLIVTELKQTDANGWSSFKAIAAKQGTLVFTIFIEKLSTSSLNELVTEPVSKKLWPILYQVAVSQGERGFITLVNKLSPATLTLEMEKTTPEGSTVLTAAMNNQSSAGVLALLRAIDTPTLSNALKKEPDILDKALQYQSIEVIYCLITKADNNTIIDILSRATIPASTHQHLAGYLLNENTWQQPSLIKCLFESMPEQLTTAVLEKWMTGGNISNSIYNALQQYLENKKSLTPLEQDWLVWWGKNQDLDYLPLTQVTTGQGRILDVCDPKLADFLWCEGVRSYADFRLVVKTLGNHRATQALTTLYGASKLKIGSTINYADYLTLSDVELNNKSAQALFQKFHQQSPLLVKIIKTKDWSDFLKQIKNYEYRPKLRKEIDNGTHKYVHMSEQVVPYKKHDKPKQKPAYKHTKKTSTTLLSAYFNNGLFGDHNDRPMVGLIFDAAETIMKALLLKDRGTYFHGWIGNQKEVLDYAVKMSGINMTSFAQFKNYIDANPNQLNEVLAKLSRKSIMAIVIVYDTELSRSIARSRQQDLEKILQHPVPIFFMARTMRDFRLYSMENIKADESKDLDPDTLNANLRQNFTYPERLGISQRSEVSYVAEMESKHRLLAIEAAILAKPEWLKHNFLHQFISQPAKISKEPNKLAHKILRLIKNAKQSSLAGCWSMTDAVVAKKLSRCMVMQLPELRNPETQAFYKHLFEQYYQSHGEHYAAKP